MSDGGDHKEFGGLLVDPPSWKDARVEKRNPKTTKLKSKESKKKTFESSDDTDDDVIMVYDTKTNQLVPLVTIE